MTAEQQGSETCPDTGRRCQHGCVGDTICTPPQQEAVGTRIARMLIVERNARVLHSPAWFAFDEAARIARGVDR